LTAFFGFAALALTAKAHAPDQIAVNIPYEFVAAGKTLPAGMYRVGRLNDHDEGELILTSIKNRAGVILLSSVVESTAADKPAVTFTEIGGQHFLSKIETADHIFAIPVAKSAVLVAASHQGSTGSGSSGRD
jgi:hypothetical protein